MDDVERDRPVRPLAFFERSLVRRSQGGPFQNVSPKSRRELGRLVGSRTSLRFRVALQQLRFDWDLLSAEAALNPDALRLRLRVLDLSADFRAAERLIRPCFDKAPLGRLFSVIVAQADQDGATQIELLGVLRPKRSASSTMGGT